MNVLIWCLVLGVVAYISWRLFAKASPHKARKVRTWLAGAKVQKPINILWWILAIPAILVVLAVWCLLTPKAWHFFTDSIGLAETSQQTNVAPNAQPQGKSVGGPLRWSDNANAKLRGRASLEEVHDGACFVGIIPPSSWLDPTLSCYTSGSGQWEAFLVDTNGIGFLPQQGLGVQAVRNHYTNGTVFDLPELSGPKMKDGKGVKNETSLTSQNGFAVNEMYLQIVGQGPNKIQVDRVEPSGVFQYEVKIGTNTTSFTIPHQNWKWLWIAAVHHPKYQALLDDAPIPSKGMPLGSYRGILATMATVNGNTGVVDQPLLYQANQIASPTIDLFLNLPEELENQIGSITGTTVIVGIQL